MQESLKGQKLLRLKTWQQCPWPCPGHFWGIAKQGENQDPSFLLTRLQLRNPFVLPKNTIWDVMESKPVARVESQATCAERVEGCRRQWPCRVRLCQKGKLRFLIQTICQSTSKTRHSGANSWKLPDVFDMTRIPILLMSWPDVITFFAAKDMGIEGSLSLDLFRIQDLVRYF